MPLLQHNDSMNNAILYIFYSLEGREKVQIFQPHLFLMCIQFSYISLSFRIRVCVLLDFEYPFLHKMWVYSEQLFENLGLECMWVPILYKSGRTGV